MIRIDTHQHFWNYDPVRDAWITPDMAVIQRDFLPEDLKPLYEAAGVSACVAVQADQSEAETQFLLGLADRHPFIAGVVGWVDLQAADVADQLAYFSLHPKFKGVRHIVQGEQDPQFMLRPAFRQGIAALAPYGLTYDILVRSHQLAMVLAFLEYFPDQPFVIDHAAKPDIRAGVHQPWADQMRAIAAHPNVYCKLSGMVTEADWAGWKPDDFRFYVEHLLEIFGPERLMYGSDWPVCLVAASYPQVVSLADGFISQLSKAEQERIWYRNALSFYHLSEDSII